jgi:hypothetical protein
MSIVTLKRKTQTQYNNMSVGLKGFSLNGTLRNQGFVGQTTLSRSLPRTLMRGNVARGYGGCCGQFLKVPIVQSAVISLNNPNVVKPSVVGTKGMLEQKYQCCHQRVKPDSNQNSNDQGSYVDFLARKTMYNVSLCNIPLKNIKKQSCCPMYNPYYRKTISLFTKAENLYTPISAAEHIRQLNKKCTKQDIHYVPNNLYNTPIGCKQ